MSRGTANKNIFMDSLKGLKILEFQENKVQYFCCDYLIAKPNVLSYSFCLRL